MSESANALQLSDEEFMSTDPATFEELDSEENTETVDESTEEVTEEESSDSEAQEQPEPEVEDEEVSQPDEDTQTEHETESNSEEPESLDTSSESQTDTDGDTQETKEIDYESAYRKVMSPFKANGTTMQVDNPEDAVRLMQMGANYQKKMASMKPNLKLVKMLENNGLLDEDKLNNLIDLSKKDPAAVAKLIKESGVDPLDIDTDKEVEYKPTNYGVSDKELELDQALDSIKDSETFNKTIDVMSKEWDNESKTIVSDNPEIIGIIDTHMQNGVYEKINELIVKEKALGRLTGVPDVVAYKQAAEYLAQTGALVQEGATPPPESNVSSDVKAKSDTKLKQKRKAAAPTKKTSTSTSKSDEDFLGLSDEDFMKKYSI